MGGLLIVGNWKMNLGVREARAYLKEFLPRFRSSPGAFDDEGDTVLAPTFTTLGALHQELTSTAGLMLGSQNIHWVAAGAHTGEVSPEMLKELGVKYAIVGHSERRQLYGETDSAVSRRARHAIEHGIRPIVCVGESLTAFELGDSVRVVARQLTESLNDLTPDDVSSLIVAYEPVWAIGTGKAATPEIIGEIHRKIRQGLVKLLGDGGATVPIIYGGSTTAENIGPIIEAGEVAGALVGGTSLKPDAFLALIDNAREAAKGMPGL